MSSRVDKSKCGKFPRKSGISLHRVGHFAHRDVGRILFILYLYYSLVHKNSPFSPEFGMAIAT